MWATSFGLTLDHLQAPTSVQLSVNKTDKMCNQHCFKKTIVQDDILYGISYNTVCSQKNGAVSKVNKKFISHLTRGQRTPSAAATVQVSHALPAVRFSCLLRGRGASFKDGVAAGKGFLCAPY
jgi:hypothetical protein